MAKILIVEPAPGLRDIYRRIVVGAGHQAIVTDPRTSSADVLTGVDAVLIDPELHEFVALLERAAPRVPLIWMSKHAAWGDDRGRCGSVHLTNPFTVAGVERALSVALAQRPRVLLPAS